MASNGHDQRDQAGSSHLQQRNRTKRSIRPQIGERARAAGKKKGSSPGGGGGHLGLLPMVAYCTRRTVFGVSNFNNLRRSIGRSDFNIEI